MAKKRPSGKKSERVAPTSAPAVPRKKKPVPPRTDYSLDDILAEFRSGGEKTPEVPAAPAAGGESVPSPLTETETGLTPVPESAETTAATESGEAPHTEGYEEPEEYAPPLSEDLPVEETPAPPKPRFSIPKDSFLYKLQGKILGRLALMGMKREQQKKQEQEKPPEIDEREMEPMDAARFYAKQMPALRRRCQMAAAISFLPVWIALASVMSVPIPGALASDIRVASLVSLTAMLTVMIIGLDVITSGILSLCRGCPGQETLIALGCLFTVIDCLVAAFTGKEGTPLPPCAVCCVSVTLCLLGSWFHCKTYRATYLALHRNPGAFTVTSEKLLGQKEAFLIKSRQSPAGFVRRSEERDGCESISGDMALYICVTALILAVLSLIGSKEAAMLPHALAVLLCVTAAWPGLFALPGFMADVAVRFQRSGCAVAGWNGIREVGESRYLIITDSDLFPEGTVSLSSVNIVEGVFTDRVIAVTGSMMTAAGTELAGIFGELMERSGGRMQEVADFTVGEGGASGTVDGMNVYVGCAGYMHLQGVKIPPRLLGGETIYTAFDRKLVGAFKISYTAEPSIAAALQILHKSKRKPIFAVRDFNIDAKMVREKFGCPVDDFEFPDVPERYATSTVGASGESVVSALISGGGLGRLAELYSRSRRVYWIGLACEILTVGCALIGLLYGFISCWKGSWAAVSSFRLLVYMLCWTLPCMLMGLTTGSKDEK